jgi:hypothetical protein
VRRKAPQIGDIVKPSVPSETLAGYIVAKEGIHVWVRYFDDSKVEDGDRFDVYTRRDNLEVISRANSH